ncbi:hypothetical protein [Paraburkholderia sp. BL6669N2]|uniref:hypothetical protein n=1 Tax=Paraburkholderia sp. BL6669N2 TaxID=1938807 RepID=UPI0011C0283E|nr:hypothetical protein [Paraburkholderia sp. BL6669N2]
MNGVFRDLDAHFPANYDSIHVYSTLPFNGSPTLLEITMRVKHEHDVSRRGEGHVEHFPQ